MRIWNQFVFTIADLTICFQTEQKVALIESFIPFCSEKKPDYIVQFYEVPALKPFPEKWEYEGISYIVASDGCGNFQRCFRDVRRNNRLYAIAKYDWVNKYIYVEYLSGSLEFISEIGTCFFHIAWEALLMHEHRIMFHSSFVETPFGGLLFAGPSGIGKSTQAELWCRFGNGRLINGDRTILYRKDEEWIGYGSPYAGSSRCYVNEKCSIRAIIILEQDKKCELRRLSVLEGFHRIFPCLTVNSWDREFVSFACDFAENMANEIPVYQLTCTPDENAVKALEDELQKACGYGTKI